MREAHSPINQYDDRSLDADLNVAFAWQSGHRPLQRGITYGLDGAYPHQLQPALLRAYEWASTRWHEFIHQPSKKVPCEGKTTFPSNNYRGQKRRSSMSLLNQLNSPPRGSKKRQKTSTTSMVVLPSSIGQSSLIDQHHSSLHLEGLVSIIHQYHILVCRLCHIAVRPGNSIEHHFRGMHKLKGEKLQQIKVFCSGWSFADPWEVKLPQNFSKAIPELPVYAGYSCMLCNYLTISRDRIMDHKRKVKHQAGSDKVVIWKSVWLQTFTKGRCVRYWIVLEDEKRRIGTAVNGRGEHMAGISGRGLLVLSE